MKIFSCFKKHTIVPGKVIIDNNGNTQQYIYSKKKLILVPYDNNSLSSKKVFIKI